MENVHSLRPDRPKSPEGRRWGMWLTFGGIIAALVAFSLVKLWVDLLWFEELGQRDVLVTRLQWSTVMGIGTGLLAFVVLYVNFRIAARVGRNDLFVPFLAQSNPEAPDQPTIPHYIMRPIMLGVAVLGGLFTGLVMAGHWETVLRFIGRSDFGITEPIFHHDVSFYVFSVPMLELIAGFLQTLVVLTLIAVLSAYVAMGVVRYTPVPRIARHGVLHLAGLLAAFFVLQAFSYRIDVWNIVLSRKGAATGAGFTDVHARMPGYWAMAIASLVLAVVIVVLARRNRWRGMGYALVGWFALSVVVTALIPGIVQTVLVEPNEIRRESKVLKNNISMTREGYGLNEVRRQPFNDDANLTPQDLRNNRETTSNIRLWSPDVLQRALAQLQEFRSYYEFNDVDVDRYKIDGQYRQVMLAVRELDPELLTSKTWVNQRLQYTHGYGVVGVWPNRSTSRGRPEMFLRDIPPVPIGQKDIKVTRPEVYFGEEAEHPVIVNTDEKEFDFPKGDGNQDTQYAGKGGIQISSFARRLALAATFGDPRIVLTGEITTKSRFMYRRHIGERIKTLAPFLSLDSDPYIVLHKGRMLWVQDAYTRSDRFPYSEASLLAEGGEVNYVRNSVKAVVDAYSGEVKLYVNDPKDPVLKAWRDIFPTLFEDMAKLPPELVAHLRYPEDLFNLQTNKWLTYHMGEFKTFYNREDLWEVPNVNGEELQPFYILAKLPGVKGAREEMLLVRPMVPKGKKNLIAYMAARMDGEHYGEILTITLPKQTLTQGPQQISALIKQDPEISQQLTLWRGQDSDPVFGNLLVLPIEDSLLYVQPVYLESQEAELPEFERVVVVLGDTIAWGDDFGSAVEELFRKRGIDNAADAIGDEESGTSSDDAGGSDAGGDAGAGADGALPDAQLRKVLTDVGDHYDKALSCQRAGDWECYGREIKEVQALLRQAGVSDSAATASK